ncbi:tyrosine--tRNA ligase [Borrelia hermsii]|uniref:Tyrosine--tRNA ligase n=3 Tax=Borrelia hermsii TaxID=140 RepID=SYY_BORHD|nr:tyrosine--tRNA ligase [Borrelia hermsii]B2S074.1 RecName: Full=Tyrosine--tRNA ligase; AltName: Full=Tyrosyl-tRNA synthetase; Short=TyrRS [Borrelia hermsii DAH]AAX16880.1 tyrosyl-tRNA synthetase [Borrelia hermsii DAH]AJW73178.1 tyrosyl-tRNA synthetase [Borrelia hermsii CC1]AMR75469.1 Tyrosyl-tRNA synthetase [Borrelia hermsii]ANA43179.1 tyrosine--tRNA ligase [Borrelia hermsii HS1]UCP01386.1 tyrosine--tRNA ligase [Borrelia hermsii]
MNLALGILEKRGFLKQCTNLEALSVLMDREKMVFYVGVDATSTSLHIGHLIPFMAMAHLQRQGHIPIALVGGGTTKIGDPSGKDVMRKILPKEDIEANVKAIKEQLLRIIDFSHGYIIDNSEWLDNINYIEFLRDIGVYFSVNRMLGFETYKRRLKDGLSFIEFNYQLLQSYDFYMLNKLKNCKLQIGGDDQWGNIVSGVDLVKRKLGTEVFGLTLPLITRSDGKKMGKSEKGAVYLDSKLYSVYDFYQYFRNVPDLDVKKFLYLFTFLEDDEIEHISSFQGYLLNKAKETLAFEITKIVHGESAALKASSAASAAFKGGEGDKSDIPFFKLALTSLEGTILLVDLMVSSKIVSSKSEARRLISSGGVYVDKVRIGDQNYCLNKDSFANGAIELRIGKKKILRIIL